VFEISRDIVVMASGRVEIAYTGIQDTFLTGEPQFTYFQRVYKQHTKFAIEVMDTPIDGTLNFGQNLVATIPRMGDMIRTIYLRVLLSNVYSAAAVSTSSNVGYTDSIGNALIEYADLIIGGQTIQRINGEFMEIYSDMWVSDSQQASMKALVGTNYSLNALTSATGGPNTSLYIIPLPFYFYKDDSMAIPLSAITFQEVQVRIQLRPLSQLIVPAQYAPGNYPGDAIANILQMSVPVEFIFLSTPELNYIKTRQLDYAITQVQQNKQTINSGNTFTQMQLTFINPVRELYMVIQTSNALTNNDLFSYSNIYQGTPVDILRNISLTFNNETRINSEIANYLYLRRAQPLNFHTRSPTRYIYSYSFSLFPENSEPSGQTNMSRIINKLLNVNINSQEFNVEVRVYARSYNILRIRNGLAGVIFIDNNFF
jgi:hypothetical protein